MLTRREECKLKKIFATVLVVIIGAVIVYQNELIQMPKEGERTVQQANSNELPANMQYDGKNQVVSINGNKPDFTENDLKLNKGSWQSFTDLDTLNRVGVANAMLSKDLMPSAEREPLYVNPTGWKNKKTKTGWLYNRCHLVGYQLTGENNNMKNLMTGTRSFNTPGMLTYENEVANYIRKTKNHVRYQVKPLFKGDELVARGVQIQAQSIEDNQVQFNVIIFNVEQDVDIDYSTGKSTLK